MIEHEYDNKEVPIKLTWRHPYDINAQLLEVVKLRGDALDVAPAVAVGIKKRGWIDLVDDGFLPPRFSHLWCAQRRCAFLQGDNYMSMSVEKPTRIIIGHTTSRAIPHKVSSIDKNLRECCTCSKREASDCQCRPHFKGSAEQRSKIMITDFCGWGSENFCGSLSKDKLLGNLRAVEKSTAFIRCLIALA